jgi:hypothetical protein
MLTTPFSKCCRLVLAASGAGVLTVACLGQEPAPAPAQDSPSLRLVSRVLSPEMPGFYNALYAERTGTRLRSGDRFSADNGAHWQTNAMTPDYTSGLPAGYRRNLVTAALDSSTGKLLAIINAMDTAGLDPKISEPKEAQQTYYLRYRVSADGGRSWLFEEPILQDGYNSATHPFAGVWIGSNSVYLGDIGSVPLFTREGGVLVPAQTTPLGPDGKLWNPTGGHTYTDVLVLLGNWTKAQRLTWAVSRVKGDPQRSTRGLIEPTLAEFPDGRILMVMRGSNGGKADPRNELPSYKWFSVSRDGGRHWANPERWTFAQGEPFFSPSSMSRLFRHSSGRCFWAGNLTTHNCQGNLPRLPLVLGEVDPKSLKLVRSSVLMFDTQQPEDQTRGRLDLSHIAMLEDRVSREIILIYPRSYHAYKSREWVTVRVAVQ